VCFAHNFVRNMYPVHPSGIRTAVMVSMENTLFTDFNLLGEDAVQSCR
jgi:hypothetical protein